MDQGLPETTPIPAITAATMAEVDRVAVEMGLDLLQMMELAGRSLAEVAREMLGGSAEGSRVVVMAGKGNNGGGGLVAARHLANWGARVEVALPVPPGDLAGAPAHQWTLLAAMGVAASGPRDALEGGRLADASEPPDRRPSGVQPERPAALTDRLHVTAANESGAQVLSLDLPTGLDATTGRVHELCIRAAATVTLALPKVGLAGGLDAGVVGALSLADIGIPAAVYERLGLAVGRPFARRSVVALDYRGDGWHAS